MNKMSTLRKWAITGLVTILPVALTIAVIGYAWRILDGWIGAFGVHIPGAGILVLLLLVLSVGAAVRHWIGRKIHGCFERTINRVPAVSLVYSTAREVCETLLNRDKNAFQGVVLLEFSGQKVVGFIVGDAPTPIGRLMQPTPVPIEYGDYTTERILSVFVMQAFSPAAGFVMFVPESKCKVVDMTVEAALKLVLTGGMVREKEIKA